MGEEICFWDMGRGRGARLRALSDLNKFPRTYHLIRSQPCTLAFQYVSAHLHVHWDGSIRHNSMSARVHTKQKLHKKVREKILGIAGSLGTERSHHWVVSEDTGLGPEDY